jgi:hypothetical protein
MLYLTFQIVYVEILIECMDLRGILKFPWRRRLSSSSWCIRTSTKPWDIVISLFDGMCRIQLLQKLSVYILHSLILHSQWLHLAFIISKELIFLPIHRGPSWLSYSLLGRMSLLKSWLNFSGRINEKIVADLILLILRLLIREGWSLKSLSTTVIRCL